jgi:hypothetical protein
LDLVCAWHLLDAGPRQVLRDDLDCDDLEWERGKAWAFEQTMGQHTLQPILADISTSAGHP